MMRIFYFAKTKARYWLLLAMTVAVLGHLAFGLEFVVLMFFQAEAHEVDDVTLGAMLPFTFFNILSEVLVASALCALLRHNRKSGVNGVREVVKLLIVYAINRCVLVTIVSIIETTIFLAWQSSLWWVTADFVIGKIWANSFLVSLNSRDAIRKRFDGARTPSSLVNAVNLSEAGPCPHSRKSDGRQSSSFVLGLPSQRGSEQNASANGSHRTYQSSQVLPLGPVDAV